VGPEAALVSVLRASLSIRVSLVVSPVMSQMVRRQRLILLEKFTFYYHHFTRTCIQATFVTTSTITLVIHIVILTQSSELCNIVQILHVPKVFVFTI